MDEKREIAGFPVALSKTKAGLLTEIFEERDRQDKKWGDQRNLSDLRWLGILAEEMGEAADAVLSDDPEQMRDEVIQACAVCLVWLECIDRDDPIRDRHKNAAVLRVIAKDIERGEVQPRIAKLSRMNFLMQLARHLEEN
jgi:NTP pyrophosphatase (non-canonical NTP hydrolase)